MVGGLRSVIRGFLHSGTCQNQNGLLTKTGSARRSGPKRVGSVVGWTGFFPESCVLIPPPIFTNSRRTPCSRSARCSRT